MSFLVLQLSHLTNNPNFQGEKSMKIKHLYYVLSLLVAMSMVLAACAPQVAATTEAPRCRPRNLQ